MFVRLSFILAICMAVQCSAANSEPWERVVTNEERGNAVHLQTLPDGGFIVAGQAAFESARRADGWVARYTKDGQQVWSVSFEGPHHVPISDIVFDDQRILVSGTYQSPNPFSTNYDSFLAALTFDGEKLWETRYNDPSGSLWGGPVHRLKSGNILVSGLLSIPGSIMGRSAHYSVFSSDGELEWMKQIVPTGQYYDDLEVAKSSARNPDGELILHESAGPVIEQDDGNLHLHIVRADIFATDPPIGRCVVFDEAGEEHKQASCTRLDEWPEKAALLPFRGSKVSPGSILTRGILIEKLDEQSERLWQWSYKTDTGTKAGLSDFLKLPDGGVIGVGYVILDQEDRAHRYDALMLRLDGDGNEVWSHVIGGDKRDVFNRIIPVGEDEFYIIGQAGSEFGAFWDPWIMKIGIDGQLPAERQFD